MSRASAAGEECAAAADANVRSPLFFVGFVTLLGQVVILREVLVAFFGSELIYVLAMGVQMLGTAAGALAGRRLTATEKRIRIFFLAFAVLLPGLVVLTRALRLIFKGTPGAYLPFAQQLVGMAIVLLPLGALGGLLFTAAARLYVGDSRTLAAAYAIESIGGLIGGAASTVLLAAGVQNFASAILCAIVAALAASSNARPRLLAAAASATVLLLVAALVRASSIDRALTALNHPQLLATRDTPYGRATVTGSLGQIVVFENDALAFESEGTTAEEFVHLAALQVVRPRSVLILGGAVEGLAAEVAKHAPLRIEDVEVDGQLVDLVRSFLSSKGARYSASTTYGEPRRFLERPAQVDLILSAMPEPESGQASRFYTREFFESCARRLAPGGVMAFRLRSSENLWTPALARRTASIVNAARRAFADVVVLPGAMNVVVASNAPLQRDPDVLARRFRDRRIEARLISPAYLRYLYTNDRFREIANLLASTPAPESTDARPVCYQYTAVLWLSRFFPSLANVDSLPLASARGRMTALALVAAAVLMLVLISRRSETWRRVLLVSFAGFAGVVLEAAVLLDYQMSEGVLYEAIGILLTMFMSGLAAGSWLMNRNAAVAGARTGVILIAGSAAVSCVIAWIVWLPAQGLLPASILLFAAGAITGAIFAFASLQRIDDQSRVVAPLYAADLSGGVAGSLGASLILIPAFGLVASVLLIAFGAILVLPLVRGVSVIR